MPEQLGLIKANSTGESYSGSKAGVPEHTVPKCSKGPYARQHVCEVICTASSLILHVRIGCLQNGVIMVMLHPAK